MNRGGYVDAKVFATVEAGRESTVGTVQLQPFDPVATRIDPDGGSHTDSTGTVQVLFPSGAIGTLIEVTATVFPTAESFPVDLPPGQAYLGGVQFTPENLTFATPVTVRVPNTQNLPPGTPVPFAFANHGETDPAMTFFDPGTGQVSADGASLEFELPHFSCIMWGFPAVPPPTARPPQLTQEPDQPLTEAPQKCCLSGSRIGARDGTFALDLPLPAVRTLGRAQPLTLTYHSGTAEPQPLILAETLNDPATTLTPDTMTWRLRVGSTEEVRTFQGQPGAARFAFRWDARDRTGRPLPTGAYTVKLELTNTYPGLLATTDRFGGPPLQPLGIPAPTPAGLTSLARSRILVHNRRASPFGAGWGLQGLAQLHPQPDGSLLLTEGRGAALLFRPQGTLDPDPFFTNQSCGITGRLSGKIAIDQQ
ncbi:MAG: hypothetical protein ACE5JQ_16785, partial [Candidatus Methylomirabilales bacterium]